MTEQTAKEVFDILLSEIRANGFIDIGTFMIEKIEKENEFEELNERDEHVDTDKIISTYEDLSGKPQRAKEALIKLVDAGVEYFLLASRVPENYSFQLKKLNSGFEIGDKIIAEDINGDSVEIDSILKSESITDIISLLNLIKNGLDQDDETFINSFK